VERWTADDWDLEQAGVRGWEYRDGTDQVSAPVGANGAVPNRTGEIWRPKALGPGMFTLGIWFKGTDRAMVEDQFRLLLRAVVRPHRLVRIDRYMANGDRIQCYAEYAGSIKPTYISQRGMKASIDFKVPSGVWKGTTLVSQGTVAGAALTQTLSLPGLAKSTAAIEDSKFTIYGPISNAVVVDRTDGVDGDSFKYAATIGANQSLTVDCKTWAVTGGGGLVVNHAAILPSGRRHLTIPPPRPGANPTLQLRGTGGGATTRLTAEAYPSFVC
jgi:hypothetical protein